MDMQLVNKLLSFIPDEELEKFAIDTSVNNTAKKLHGQLLFKLLFYCTVTEKDNSLRGLQSTLESAVFRSLSNVAEGFRISHSSISERLNVINVDFFEKIFQYCIAAYKQTAITLDQEIVRFDSTIISASTKLLKVGYNLRGSAAEQHQLIKFTIGYSDLPECICLYKDLSYTSENKALAEAILANQKTATQINVFDRGITARSTYDRMTAKNISFISRITPEPKHQKHLANKIKKNIQTNTLTIMSDSWVYLYTPRGRCQYPIRLIEAVQKSNNEPIAFVTNIVGLTTKEITEIYKTRWDIEVFFKFLKQHLNFSHLLNRTENGIKVMMYVTMIVAILLAEYKKIKSLSGFKIPKKKFAQELENDIIYYLVMECKGDPEIAKRLIYSNST